MWSVRGARCCTGGLASDGAAEWVGAGSHPQGALPLHSQMLPRLCLLGLPPTHPLAGVCMLARPMCNTPYHPHSPGACREHGAGIYSMTPYWAAEMIAEVPWIILLATICKCRAACLHCVKLAQMWGGCDGRPGCSQCMPWVRDMCLAKEPCFMACFQRNRSSHYCSAPSPALQMP